MNGQFFTDGVGAVSIVGGVVRIDLVVLSPTEKETGGQPKAVFQQQIVMGIEAFLRSTEKMQSAAQAWAKIAAQQPMPKGTEPRSVEPDRQAPTGGSAVKSPFP